MHEQKRTGPPRLLNDIVFFSSGDDCIMAEFICILKHFNSIYSKHVTTVIVHLYIK